MNNVCFLYFIFIFSNYHVITQGFWWTNKQTNKLILVKCVCSLFWLNCLPFYNWTTLKTWECRRHRPDSNSQSSSHRVCFCFRFYSGLIHVYNSEEKKTWRQSTRHHRLCWNRFTNACVCVFFLKSYVKDRDNIRAGVSLTLLLLFSGGLTSGVSGGFYWLQSDRSDSF